MTIFGMSVVYRKFMPKTSGQPIVIGEFRYSVPVRWICAGPDVRER